MVGSCPTNPNVRAIGKSVLEYVKPATNITIFMADRCEYLLHRCLRSNESKGLNGTRRQCCWDRRIRVSRRGAANQQQRNKNTESKCHTRSMMPNDPSSATPPTKIPDLQSDRDGGVGCSDLLGCKSISHLIGTVRGTLGLPLESDPKSWEQSWIASGICPSHPQYQRIMNENAYSEIRSCW